MFLVWPQNPVFLFCYKPSSNLLEFSDEILGNKNIVRDISNIDIRFSKNLLHSKKKLGNPIFKFSYVPQKVL